MIDVKPIYHIPVPENRKLDFDQCNITFNIAAKVVDLMDSAIVKACVDFAKESGITDLYLIDKDFVMTTFTKQIPQCPVSHEFGIRTLVHNCPGCGHHLNPPTLGQFQNGSYCPNCGQKINWGG